MAADNRGVGYTTNLLISAALEATQFMNLDIRDFSDGAIAEISGDGIVPMLASEIGKEVAAALIDCKIYQGNSDQPATIIDCDAGSTIVAVRSSDGRKRSFALRGAELLPTQSLVAVIDTY